jgi:hypothetical protein
MNETAQKMEITLSLTKRDPTSPALKVIGRNRVVIKAGTVFDIRVFSQDFEVMLLDGELEPGSNYGVICGASGAPYLFNVDRGLPIHCFAGFHFAPGGNATGRAGGDDITAINPCSVWDLKFRPECPDPRGAFFINGPRGPAWLDIYKLGKNHLIDGTSKFGVTIADHFDPPQNPAGGYFDRLDHPTAVKVLAHHGKTLASVEELAFAAHGVTENSALGIDPKITGLDAPRTSQFGMMQATGSTWDWCHDENGRPSLFGGAWDGGQHAGSRCAFLDLWPEHSYEYLSVRGRSDHLQLA